MTHHCPDDSCRRYLVETASRVGLDVVAYTDPPAVPTPYTDELMAGGLPQCPHGTIWYFEPTDEQITAWRRDGTA